MVVRQSGSSQEPQRIRRDHEPIDTTSRAMCELRKGCNTRLREQGASVKTLFLCVIVGKWKSELPADDRATCLTT
jgi:hypothetical protein